MMKILNTEQIRKADQYTIQHEPIASIDLMERASEAFVEWYVYQSGLTTSALVICGTGNNGGDGLAVARLLSERGAAIKVMVLGDLSKATEDFTINHKKLQSMDVAIVPQDLELISQAEVIIDAIFGSGLSRPVEGQYETVIKAINESGAKKVSIDIPSGLFADSTSKGTVVEADHVVSFQVPKLAFFLPEKWAGCTGLACSKHWIVS